MYKFSILDSKSQIEDAAVLQYMYTVGELAYYCVHYSSIGEYLHDTNTTLTVVS